MNRIISLDIIRGIAIIMVIGLHGVVSISGRLDNISPCFMAFFDFIAPFRMPILMFLSGLFLSRSLSKGIYPYFMGKIYHILYPYIVWSLFMWFLMYIRCKIMSENIEFLGYYILISPLEHLWFLHSLFIFFIIASLYFIPLGNFIYFFVACFIIMCPNEYLIFRKDLFLLFSIGGLFGVYINFLNKLTVKFTIFIFGVLFFILFAFFGDSNVLFYKVVLPLSMFPLLFIMANIDFVIRHTNYIQWIGKNSLGFYLSHLPIQIILVQLLKNFHISSNFKVMLNMILGFPFLVFLLFYVKKQRP